MNKGEPPSRLQSSSSPFLVGRNSRGHWVVQDARGLSGGLFVSRAEALRYALFENGHDPRAVIMVPGNFELHLGKTATPAVTAFTTQIDTAPLAQQRGTLTLSARH